MHELIAELTEYLNLTPEQQFRVSAKIKRHIHEEKASVFGRYALYSQGHGQEQPRDPWLHGILKEKAEQHRHWAKLPDEEVITWSVGSFKYVQKIEPCSVCGTELTGKPYTRIVSNGQNNTFCQEHAPKEES
jgi:hypothetical protein